MSMELKKYNSYVRKRNKTKTIKDIFDNNNDYDTPIDKILFEVNKSKIRRSMFKAFHNEEKEEANKIKIKKNSEHLNYTKQGNKLREMLNNYMNDVLADDLLNDKDPKNEIKHKTCSLINTKENDNKINIDNSKKNSRGSNVIINNMNIFSNKEIRNSYKMNKLSLKRSSKKSEEEVGLKDIIQKDNDTNENIMIFDNNLKQDKSNNISFEYDAKIYHKNENSPKPIPKQQLFYKFDKRVITRRKLVDDSLEDDEEFELMMDFNSRFIIFRDSIFKIFWDYIIILTIFYNLFLTPIVVSYGSSGNMWLFLLELLIDVLYILDVLLNFFVAFHNFEETLVVNLKYICLNYLTGWFMIDLISAFPSNILLNFLNFNHVQINLFSFFRFNKFFKVFKLIALDDSIPKEKRASILDSFDLSSSQKRVVTFGFGFFVSIHILSCGWIYMGRLDYPNWISTISEHNNIDIYIAALYFNCTTIFTIGYGDILAVSIYERIYNIFLMVFGIGIYSFAVTSISTLITSYDTMTQKYINNIAVLHDLRYEYPSINDTLYNKLNKFINYDYRFNKTEKYNLIADLPKRIKNNVLYKMYSKIIRNYLFFKFLSKNNNDELNSKVLLSMRPVRVYKGDIIIRQKERVNEAIFVNCGVLSADVEDIEMNKTILFDLKKNEHFLGDIFMKKNDVPSPINIRVKSKVCEMYVIKKYDLLQIVKDHQEAFNDLSFYANENFVRIKYLCKQLKNKGQIKSNKNSNLNINISNKESLISELKTEKFNEIMNPSNIIRDSIVNRKHRFSYNPPNPISKELSSINLNSYQSNSLQNHYINWIRNSNFYKFMMKNECTTAERRISTNLEKKFFEEIVKKTSFDQFQAFLKETTSDQMKNNTRISNFFNNLNMYNENTHASTHYCKNLNFLRSSKYRNSSPNITNIESFDNLKKNNIIQVNQANIKIDQKPKKEVNEENGTKRSYQRTVSFNRERNSDFPTEYKFYISTQDKKKLSFKDDSKIRCSKLNLKERIENSFIIEKDPKMFLQNKMFKEKNKIFLEFKDELEYHLKKLRKINLRIKN